METIQTESLTHGVWFVSLIIEMFIPEFYANKISHPEICDFLLKFKKMAVEVDYSHTQLNIHIFSQLK